MNYNNFNEDVKRKINAIKTFAKEMGYKTKENKYKDYENNRPCYSIELIGTSDCDGNPYAWAWYTDNWKSIEY